MDKNKKVTYADKDASWELYVELNTKMTTQPFFQMYNGNRVGGVNESALESIYSIFPETRLILKQYGFLGKQFANLAFEMLNDVIRPFTTKWHRMMVLDIVLKEKNEFDGDLRRLQVDLAPYVAKFLEMANIKDKLLDKVEE